MAARPSSTMVRTALVVGVVLAVYVLVIAAYALGSDDGDGPDNRQAPANGVLVYLDLNALNGDTHSLDARVSVYPGTDLIDAGGELLRDMTVDISPAATADALTFAQGTAAGSQPTTLYVDGDIHRWPFDDYRAERLQVRVSTTTAVGGGRAAVPTQVVVTNSMTSWTTDLKDMDSTPTRPVVTITVDRTPATIAFGLALCLVLLVLPACTLFVAIHTLRRRRQFLPPIVTWFAVMLFAVLPIRNLFPGSPPIGSWVDFTVVIWVVIGLTTALALYVTAWWRQGP